MLLRQERIAFGLLCAVTLILAFSTLLLGGLDRSALAQEFREDVPDGVLARIEGEICELQRTRTGGHFMARVDDVRVFIPESVAGQVPLREGDPVRITGIVRTYQGEREIVVEYPTDIRIRDQGG